MIYYIIAGLVIVLIVLGAVLAYRFFFKKKSSQNIPEDVMKNFELAEQMIKDHGSTMTPQEIMLKIYKMQNKQLNEMDLIKDEVTKSDKPITKPVSKINPSGENRLARLFRK